VDRAGTGDTLADAHADRRRVGRTGRRVAVAVAVAAAALALVATGVTVALRARTSSGTAALNPVAGPAQQTPAPTSSPTPSATHRPAPTATTRPAAGPSPSQTPAPGTFYGEHLPGSVTLPYRPGQRSWDATSNGIRFHLTLTPAVAGSPATWHVTTSGGAGCCFVYLNFGDGYAVPNGNLDCDVADPDVTATHTYNRGGSHHFMVEAALRGTCGQGHEGIVYGTFDVAPGRSTAQGPEQPVVQFDSSARPKGHEDDRSYVTIWGEAEDEDGFLRRFVVAWGDGTTTPLPGDGNPCQTGPDGWPVGSRGTIPADPPMHHYAKPGTYTVTLTAYSTACDGSDVQTGTASFEWVVDPPEPTPSASASPSASPSASATP
jgi:hypothetical protein